MLDGLYENGNYRISFLLIGGKTNPAIAEYYKNNVPQILWPAVFNFIYKRFADYAREKGDHPQWDKVGNALWTCYENSRRNKKDFVDCFTQDYAVDNFAKRLRPTSFEEGTNL